MPLPIKIVAGSFHQHNIETVLTRLKSGDFRAELVTKYFRIYELN
jgi:hypothetical protein